MNIEALSRDEFYAYCGQPDNGCHPKYNLPKIFEADNQDIVKIFYPKGRWFSSNKHRPYAIRFCVNAECLQSLGVIAPKITAIKHCPEFNTHVVRYDKLPGVDALTLVQNGNENILYEAAAFIGMLHNKGIFFRSLHLSNLLYQQEDQAFGLIDVSDIRFKKKSLPFYLQYRNLKHTFQHRDDKSCWKKMDIEQFFQSYFRVAKSSYFFRAMLRVLLRRALLNQS